MLVFAEVFDSTVKITFYSVLFKALVAKNQKGVWFREEKTPCNLHASVIMGTYMYGWGEGLLYPHPIPLASNAFN